jgi:ParB-like chromosome segregation protein Spo0J
VIVNDRSGNLIDGHLRTIVALGYAQREKVPVLYVDLSADEERQALNLIDPISALARIDCANISLNGFLAPCVCSECGSHHFKPKEERLDATTNDNE